MHSFDGKYVVEDTVLNHYFGYLGHVSPNGLMLGMRNLLKNKGGKIRLLIPHTWLMERLALVAAVAQ